MDVGRRDERVRPFDARVDQRLLVRRVVFDHEVIVRAGDRPGLLLVVLHDDDLVAAEGGDLDEEGADVARSDNDLVRRATGIVRRANGFRIRDILRSFLLIRSL